MKRISLIAVAGMQLVASFILLGSVALAEGEVAVVADTTSVAQTVTPRPRDAKSALSDWREPKSSEPVEGAWNMLRGLGLTLGVFFIGLWVYKRLHGTAQQTQKRKLRIVERLSISSKTSLMLVQANGQEILLSVGSDRVSVIGDMSGGESCLSCSGASYEDTASAEASASKEGK